MISTRFLLFFVVSFVLGEVFVKEMETFFFTSGFFHFESDVDVFDAERGAVMMCSIQKLGTFLDIFRLVLFGLC